MARLIITSRGFEGSSIELHLGLNTFGRTEDNDWQINHPTISSRHCEIELELGAITLRDCGSTNGTFLNGEQIRECVLAAGQEIKMGDIKFDVENVDVRIAIPKFDIPVEPPPVVLPTGEMVCPNHPEATVTHRCTECCMVMCETCVHHLRRRGGKVLLLCPVCSHPVESLGVQAKKKKTFMEYLRTTVRLPFVRPTPRRPRG